MTSFRKRFIFNSDFPVDKIIWLKQGEVKMNAWGSTGDNPIQIAHNIGAQIYVNGVWTIDDWNTTYNFNAERVDGQGLVYYSFLSATNSTVYLSGAHASGANKTFKYHIWAFAEEEATKGLEAKATAGQSANKLVLSTDYSYPMLVREGKASPDTTITHSLDEIPYVEVWGNDPYNNQGYRIVTGDSFGKIYGSGEMVKVTKNQIIFSSETSLYNNYYFRIYMP